MDTTERRRANLRRLLQEQFNGNQSEMARRAEKKQTYLNEVLSGARKSIGEKFCRDIERRLDLSLGWLDGAPQTVTVTEVVVDRAGGWPFRFPQVDWKLVPEEQKAIILDAADAAVRRAKKPTGRGR